MSEPIRVLQCVNDMHRAGLETMLMNYYRHIDRTKIQFDFLTHRPYRSDYDDEIESLGGRIYYAPRLYPQNYPRYFKWMNKFFEEHPEYQIVHSHIDTMSYLPLLAAKKAGIPIRIAHSHNTSIDKDFKYFLKLFFKNRINSVCTERLACGVDAGKFLFGDLKFEVIPNAIDADEYRFSMETRNEVRNELGIKNEFVIGHVGRFSYQKNHEFLISLFERFTENNHNSKLLLIGVGEKEEHIKELVNKKNLADKVMFLGNRNDVNKLYQAMDAFVLPSFFEGIPVVGIEAQFSGLNCIFSDKIPEEVCFASKCHFVSLNNTVDWLNILDEVKGEIRSGCDIKNSKYEIRYSKEILQTLYINLSNNFIGAEDRK